MVIELVSGTANFVSGGGGRGGGQGQSDRWVLCAEPIAQIISPLIIFSNCG